MSRKQSRILAFSLFSLCCVSLFFTLPVTNVVIAQAPTAAMATVTGTPAGPSVTVREDQSQIKRPFRTWNNYPKVGVLLAGRLFQQKGERLEVIGS